MLKLPFYNRKRYVVVKAYTFDPRIYEDKTLAMTSTALGVLPRCPVQLDMDPHGKDFTTCYGLTTSMKKSITLSSWLEVKINWHETLSYDTPFGNQIFEVMPVVDTAYKLPKDFQMTKIIYPWMVTCNKHIDFVMGRHIMNKLPMHIQSGILNFSVTNAVHIFNGVQQGQDYHVPYCYPLAQIFPLTDLPIHLETYLDVPTFNLLYESRKNVPYFRASAIKLSKRKKHIDNA